MLIRATLLTVINSAGLYHLLLACRERLKTKIIDMNTKILLIDDEVAFCELCALWLEQAGYQVECAHDAATGLALFEQAKNLGKNSDQAFDLIIHDLSLPPSFRPEDSLGNLEFYNDVPVLVLTAHSDRTLALKAIELGAWDFINKPIDPDLLNVIIQRALEKNSLLQQIKNLENELGQQEEQHEVSNFGLIGKSSAVQSTRELIQRISNTQVPVLIQGPSGTGKEIIANAVHNNSDRKPHKIVSVHCGAIPAELLESELFGYKKGAFTGADSDRKGLLASADQGTLFLDEIGEMPIAMQVKLLRVLQDGSYYPVGSRQLENLNARLVCATNRDLPQEVKNGNFREDLYYRIKGLTISTTSLENRKEDIGVLVDHFLTRYNHEHKTDISLDKKACCWFINTPWPGNVRELKNTLESAAAICLTNHVGLQEIALIRGEGAIKDRTKLLRDDRIFQDPSTFKTQFNKTLEQQVSELEISLITQAMKEHQDNKTHTAQSLGITRQGLINKIKRYELI
jgi:two-component system NtrC family response regulator